MSMLIANAMAERMIFSAFMSGTDALMHAFETDPQLRTSGIGLFLLDRAPDRALLTERDAAVKAHAECAGLKKQIEEKDAQIKTATEERDAALKAGAEGAAGSSIALVGPEPGSRLVDPRVVEGRWLAPGDSAAAVITNGARIRNPRLDVGGPHHVGRLRRRRTVRPGAPRPTALDRVGDVVRLRPVPGGRDAALRLAGGDADHHRGRGRDRARGDRGVRRGARARARPDRGGARRAHPGRGLAASTRLPMRPMLWHSAAPEGKEERCRSSCSSS